MTTLMEIEHKTWQDKPKTSCRYKASAISCSCIKYLPSSIPEVHTRSKAHFGQQLQFRPLPGPTQQAPEEHSQSHPCPSSALTLTEVKKGNFSKPQHNHRKPNEEPNAVIPWASNRRLQCTTRPILLCQRTPSSRNLSHFWCRIATAKVTVFNQTWSPCSWAHDWQHVWAEILKSSSSRNKSCVTHGFRLERNNQLLKVQIPHFCTAATTAAVFLLISWGKFSFSH